MSKKCPSCGSKEIIIDNHGFAYCTGCERYDMAEKFPEQTVFDQITQSEEKLADKLVYSFACYDRMGVYWKSAIIDDVNLDWSTRSEAFAATVARLKEVVK